MAATPVGVHRGAGNKLAWPAGKWKAGFYVLTRHQGPDVLRLPAGIQCGCVGSCWMGGGRGQSALLALAIVCLSLCVFLWCLLWSLSPSCVPCIPEGVTPVSESAVRCSVYLKGSSWQALSTWNPPYTPHTLECIPSHPYNLLTPSFPVITTDS